MPKLASRKVEVHVFRRRRGRVEFLTLRRSPSRRRLPGAWQPVTGKIRFRESAAHAAVREVYEETGLRPTRFWALESPIVYFDVQEDTVEMLPLFAAEIPAGARIVLSAEHDAYRFLSRKRAGKRYVWEAQRVALAACHREVLRGRARSIDPLLLDTPARPGARKRRPPDTT